MNYRLVNHISQYIGKHETESFLLSSELLLGRGIHQPCRSLGQSLSTCKPSRRVSETSHSMIENQSCFTRGILRTELRANNLPRHIFVMMIRFIRSRYLPFLCFLSNLLLTQIFPFHIIDNPVQNIRPLSSVE